MPNLFKYFILPLILFIAAAAIIFWVLLPLWQSAQAALELKKGNEDNLAQRQKLTVNLELLIGQYNKRAGDLASFGKAIPVGQNIPELLINLEALASENGLIFSGVNFKPKDLNAPNVKTLIMEVNVKGSYPAFQNYLKAMEKSLRLFDVTSVSFNGVAPGQTSINLNNLEFNLSVNTYYQ
ncbi:MAG: type 4a pilus biogenesis protein PilO [Candidatus Azambacteria bacterium]|nr:type 4a pilus biogenesis protein PilO [Candidatus Azambacteria bacterium]